MLMHSTFRLDYQRNFVWTDVDCSYFIESVLIGLPIPYMFFADAEDGRTEIVDGAQRMNALVNFARGDLTLCNLGHPYICQRKDLFRTSHRSTKKIR